MNQAPKKFKEFYLENLLAFLWNQWSDLGVAGYGSGQESYSIDPEALLLLSCVIARYDSRLFDEIINWLNTNGHLINVQRLKKILNSHDFSGTNVLSAIAAFMARGNQFRKWNGLSRPFRGEAPENLFFLKDGSPMKQFATPDPLFLKQGYLRGKVELRKNLSPIKTGSNNCLILKLRFLFGINARSEIILYLLKKGRSHPGKIAKGTYYSPKTVQDTLIELERSGAVGITRTGREKYYWLDNEKWAEFLMLKGESKGWINWPLFFCALEKLWLKLEKKSFENLDSEMQASELRELMSRIRPQIEEAGFFGVLSDDKLYLGESYLEIFESDIKKLMDLLK